MYISNARYRHLEKFLIGGNITLGVITALGDNNTQGAVSTCCANNTLGANNTQGVNNGQGNVNSCSENTALGGNNTQGVIDAKKFYQFQGVIKRKF